MRGLRRGEVAGLRQQDLDADAAELAVQRQIVALPGTLFYGPPKSLASNRTVALDSRCLDRIVEQIRRRRAANVGAPRHRSDARERVGDEVDDDDALFTYADGRPVKPEYLSHRFRQIVRELGLPPIRFHDLRHGAATLALAAHTDLKVIQQMLGHSSIVTTADTYTSVLPEVAHAAAQASADLIMQVERVVANRVRRDVGAPQQLANLNESGYWQT